MKESQHGRISSMNDFEDLTLFINESFDTDEVDLFEFTSEESSPLTKLKSIILSLDWEITDDILQELADELEHVSGTWQGDKVAEIYLQGLSKIGRYIREKGAHAHQNSIKLLLTFFYDFEKIISSTQITGDEITKLIKSDVRKFKILQYQITQNELTSPEQSGLGEESISPDDSSGATTEQDACKQLKAIILSIDWEVTSENLRQFNERLDLVQTQAADNKSALILMQGLRALGDYIADERSDAHPDSFTLLHSFNDALEEIMQADGQQLSQEHIHDILVDRINRLNNLKMLIVSPTAEIDDQKLDQVFEELNPVSADNTPSLAPSSPSAPAPDSDMPDIALTPDVPAAPTGDLVAAEPDTFLPSEAIPAMESAGIQYPDEVLSPDAIHPVDDELADDLIESQLSSKRGLAPALSDATETAGFDAETDPLDFPVQHDLAKQLDCFFADLGDDEEPAAAPDASTLPPAIEDEKKSFDDLTDDEEEPPMGGSVVAALSDVDVPAGGNKFSEAEAADFGDLETQNKLDSFFADADEETDDAGEEPPMGGSVVAALSDVDVPADGNEFSGTEVAGFGDQETQNKLDSFFADADEETDDAGEEPPMGDSIVAALNDIDVPADGNKFSEAEAADFGDLETQNKLDSFFADADEETDDAGEEPPMGDSIVAALNDIDVPADGNEFSEAEAVHFDDPETQDTLDSFFAGEEEDFAIAGEEQPVDDSVTATLNDAEIPADEDEPGIVVPEIEETKLDSFFADTREEQYEPATVPSAKVEEIERGLFFSEANTLQTALAGSEEEQGFSEEDEIAALDFTPMDEIEEKLDLFFGSNDEDTIEDNASLAGSLEESLGFDVAGPDAEPADFQISADLDTRQPDEEAADSMDVIETMADIEEELGVVAPFEVDELTMALEATIDSQPSEPPISTDGSEEIQLAALGALLPLVVRTPSSDNLAESTAMIATLKQTDLLPVQHSLVQMLETTLTLLVRLPTKEHAATEKLVNYLYEQLIAGQTDALPEVIGRFTAWLLEASRIMPVMPVAGEQQLEPQYNYTAKELYLELSELRTYMREEFAKLQHEMQHLRK